MSARARLIVGIGVSLGLLILVFWNTDWAAMIAPLRYARYDLLALAAIVTIFGVFLRAFRWRALFWPARDLSVVALFDAVNVGYMANNLLPARAGDVLRAYFAQEWAGARVAHALSSTVVERVIDTLLIVAMIFALLPFLPLPASMVEAGILIGVVFIALSVGLVVISLQRERGRRLLSAVLRLAPRLDPELWSERLISLLDGFAILRAPGPLARVLSWSVIIWLNGIAVYLLTFRAFGLTSLSPAVAVLTICAAALGMALPSAPSAAGVFHGAAFAVLVAFSVPDDMARLVAVTLHALNFIPLTITGFWSLARRGLSYRDLLGRAPVRPEPVLRAADGSAQGEAAP